MSIGRGMDKKAVLQIHNGNSAINKNAFEISSNEVGENGTYYTE